MTEHYANSYNIILFGAYRSNWNSAKNDENVIEIAVAENKHKTYNVKWATKLEYYSLECQNSPFSHRLRFIVEVYSMKWSDSKLHFAKYLYTQFDGIK